MAFQKYCSLENAQVLEIGSSPTRYRTASLDKFSDFNDYRTEDGYLYARIRAISSRVNKNHDGWPSVELAGGPDIFERHRRASNGQGFTIAADKNQRYGYSTFLGKPLFVDHHNSDPSRARGAIVDSKLHVEDHRTAAGLDSYYASAPDNHLPPTWVELLIEVDAKSFPKLAKAIIEGSRSPHKGIDGFSMGCDVERSVCNICKNSATSPDDFCQHVRMKGAHFDWVNPKSGRKESKRSYEDCYGVKFFEISAVFDPADETALLREVRSNSEGEYGEYRPHLNEIPCRDCGGTGYDDMFNQCPSCWGHGIERNIPPVTVPGGDGAAIPEEIQPHNTQDFGQNLGPPHFGATTDEFPEYTTPPFEADPNEVLSLAREYASKGVDFKDALQMAAIKFKINRMHDESVPTVPGGDGADAPAELRSYNFNPLPQGGTLQGLGEPHMGTQKFAENPLPQSMLTHMPTNVDTLRQESICPICGSNMDSEECEVCGYEKEPEGFDNPDLSQAKETQMNAEQDSNTPGTDITPQGAQDAETGPTNSVAVAHVNSDMAWRISLNPRVAAGINPAERPLLSDAHKPATDEPRTQQVLKDQAKPITSSVRTAEDFLAAAGATQRNQMENHLADAASGAPSAKPGANVDVLGVGGVMDASNDAASKANSQVDVLGIGGTGVEGVEAESHENVDQGNEHSKNIEAIPTKTFGEDDYHITDPVTREPFPASGEGVKSSAWTITALDAAPFPSDDGGLAGGKAVQGVQPVDPVGTAQDRVNVLDAVTTPENNSGPTTTWSGTDGNGVLRQQEPVTTESIALGESGGQDGANWTTAKSSSHLLTAFKLADLEVGLGLLDEKRKYARIAELEQQSTAAIEAALGYALKVRTAGLTKKVTATKRLPSLARQASSPTVADPRDVTDDSALFT